LKPALTAIRRLVRSSSLLSTSWRARLVRPDWYADYTDALRPKKVDEVIAFSFSNGEPVSMTRGEMLLHVAMHAAGHRGQVALLLQKNGIQPFPDRITDFLRAEDAPPNRQAAVAEAAA